MPVSHKLLGSGAVRVRIAVAGGLLLVVGAFLRPPAATTTLSASQERAAPLLEEQVQLRERPFAGLQNVATRVRGQSVAVLFSDPRSLPARNDFVQADRMPRAAGFAVFVSDRYLLTHAASLAGQASTQLSTADGRGLDARVVAHESSTELALLETEQTTRTFAAIARTPPQAGMLSVAVGQWEGSDIVVPVFVTSVRSDRYTIGPTDPSVLPGMPLYNLDGELFAVTAGSAGRAIPVREAVDRLLSRAAAGERLGSFGVAFQGLSGALTRAFSERGLLISDVIDGGPAALAGIQAGDVLLAIGDVEVSSIETATPALNSVRAGIPATLRLVRNGRVHAVEVTPAPAYEVAALARLAADDSATGPAVGSLLAGTVLDRAGVPATARVLSVNGRAVSSRAQADRELRRGRGSVLLLLRDGGQQFFAVIERAR